MPPVVGFLSGLIATAIPATAATISILGITATTTVASLIANAVVFGGIYVYSKNKLDRRARQNGGVQISRVNPSGAKQLIYGRQRVSGDIIALSTSGKDNKYLEMIYAVAGHKINAVKNIWIDGKLALEVTEEPVTENSDAFVRKYSDDFGFSQLRNPTQSEIRLPRNARASIYTNFVSGNGQYIIYIPAELGNDFHMVIEGPGGPTRYEYEDLADSIGSSPVNLLQDFPNIRKQYRILPWPPRRS